MVFKMLTLCPRRGRCRYHGRDNPLARRDKGVGREYAERGYLTNKTTGKCHAGRSRQKRQGSGYKRRADDDVAR